MHGPRRQPGTALSWRHALSPANPLCDQQLLTNYIPRECTDPREGAGGHGAPEVQHRLVDASSHGSEGRRPVLLPACFSPFYEIYVPPPKRFQHKPLPRHPLSLTHPSAAGVFIHFTDLPFPQASLPAAKNRSCCGGSCK